MAVSGMGMMMKSLGIDPEKIMGDVQAFQAQVNSSIQTVADNQTRVEEKLDCIYAQMGLIFSMLEMMDNKLMNDRDNCSCVSYDEKGLEILSV